MYLAHRRGWPSLNLASFVLTLFTVTAWMVDRYTSSRYLSTEIFLDGVLRDVPRPSCART